jgi:DNA polymerase V
MMQNLQSTDHLQQHLLVAVNTDAQQRRDRLMHTIDQLNYRYGSGAVSWAACGIQPEWSMRRNQLSRAATTRLNDVPLVLA